MPGYSMRIIDWNPEPVHEIEFRHARKGGGAVAINTLPFTLATAELPAGLSGLVLTADLQGREILPPTNRQRAARKETYREGRRLLGRVAAAELTKLAEGGRIPPTKELGVLLAGDFWAERGSLRRGGLGEVSSVWLDFHERCKWVAGVLGNHDQLTLPKDGSATIHNLDGTMVSLDGLKIAGIGGIIGEPYKPRRKSAERYLGLLDDLLTSAPDVLLLHEPPANPEWGELGKQNISDHLQAQAPTFVVCGHCYWDYPLSELPNGTQICNVDSRVIVLVRPEWPRTSVAEAEPA